MQVDFKRLGAGPVLAVLLMLTGCTALGPDFVRPAPPSEAAFRHAPVSPSGTPASLPAAWWTLFGDARLDELEHLTLADSPTVHASAARLLQARAQWSAADAARQPTLTLGASSERLRSSATTPQAIALGGRSIEGSQHTARGTLSWELDLWGRLRRVVESAGAQAQAAEAQAAGVRLLLTTQVASLYWQWRGATSELDVVNRALVTRQQARQLVADRLRVGLASELDLDRADVELANAEAELQSLGRQQSLLEHSLAVLVGSSPSKPLPTLGTVTASFQLPAPPAVPVGLPAQVLAQRPDLAASVAQLHAASADIGIAEAAFYPTLQLTGNYGYASESLRHLANGRSRTYELGPLALTLPMLDGGRRRADLALAKARHEEAAAELSGRLLIALREVEDALSDGEHLQKQGEHQTAARMAADRVQAMATARYERGLSSYLEVTDAQRLSLAAERAATQIAAQRLQTAVALMRALGGGWQEAAPPGPVAANPSLATPSAQ